MEKFKITIFTALTIIFFVLVGYWAVNTIQSGSEHVSNEKIKALQDENESLKKQVDALQSELGSLKPSDEGDELAQEPILEPTPTPTKPTQSTTIYKNQTLINELQKLVDDKVYMKLKSNGTRVGTIQNFLNLYNKTSNKIDNDYGASTKTAVVAFQKAEGLPADGEAGPSTFQKMIDWLKKQG